MRLSETPRMVDGPDPWNIHLIDRGIIPTLLDFERNGVLINTGEAKRLGKTLDQVMEESAELTQQHAGIRFDVSSDEQYAKVLFDHLDLPTDDLKKTKKTMRPSVGNDELAKIEHLHPCISTRKMFKEAQKLKGTYVEKIPRMVDRTSRLHTEFLNGRTATGRLASKNPNLQNIPSRTALGKEVKKLFVAQPGCFLVDVDYSQIELRCAAHVSRDPTMIEVYRSGDDLHWKTAESVYLKPRDELDSTLHRKPSKITNFLTIYRGSARALLTNLIADGADRNHWNEDRTQDLIDGFYKGYPGIGLMNQESDEYLLANGYSCDMFGRTRRLEAVYSSQDHIREEALRQGGNMRIQGACASLIKIAMPLVRELCLELQYYGFVCRPLLQVHDSLVFEVSQEIVGHFIPEARRILSSVVEWEVPLDTSGDYGESWGDMQEYKHSSYIN